MAAEKGIIKVGDKVKATNDAGQTFTGEVTHVNNNPQANEVAFVKTGEPRSTTWYNTQKVEKIKD